MMPKPFVVDRAEARADDAPAVFPGPADEAGSAGGGGGPADVPQKGNVHGPERRKKGDTDKGFAEADVIVESEYFTQVQTHSALETHGFVVDWKTDEVTVYASTQGTSSVRNEFADVFKLPKSKVRVITEYMGGGFGAKFGAGNEGVVCREPVAQGERAGKADARSPAGAHCQQPARLASDAQNRSKERRHSHRHPAHQLRHSRRGNRRRHRGSSNQPL